MLLICAELRALLTRGRASGTGAGSSETPSALEGADDRDVVAADLALLFADHRLGEPVLKEKGTDRRLLNEIAGHVARFLGAGEGLETSEEHSLTP